MISLLVLTPYLYHMPNMILSSIVVVAALSLAEWGEIYLLWQTNKKDWALCMIVLNIVLWYNTETGIYVGFGLCAFEVLVRATHPQIITVDPKLVVIHLPGSATTAGLLDDEKTNVESIKDVYRGLPDDVFVCRLEGQVSFLSLSLSLAHTHTHTH